MPTYTNAEYLNDKLAPQLLKEYKDDKDDFLAAVPDAPAEAITEEGLRLMVLKETTEAVVNPGADFVNGDVNPLDHDKTIIPYDSISTKPTEVTKEGLRTAVYDKRNWIREMHNKVMMRKFRDYIIHEFAPADNSVAALPVMVTTGPDIASVRKRLAVADIIEYGRQLRNLNLDPEGGWNLRLCNDHLADLLLATKDNQDFRSHYHNMKTGEMMFELYGFKFWFGNHQTLYTSALAKKALGAAKAATDQLASVFWYEQNVCKAWGNVMVHVNPMTQDTRSNPAKEEFRVTANLKATRKLNVGTGAIVSANLAS